MIHYPVLRKLLRDNSKKQATKKHNKILAYKNINKLSSSRWGSLSYFKTTWKIKKSNTKKKRDILLRLSKSIKIMCDFVCKTINIFP